MSFRHTLAKSLDPKLKTSFGLSCTNQFVIAVIFLSLFTAILETEHTIYDNHQTLFLGLEYLFTFLFTIEYLARVWVSIENPAYKTRLHFILTPAALLDLLTILLILFTVMGSPGYIMRLARLFRIIRIAKLGHYSEAMHIIWQAIFCRRFELLISFAIGLSALIISSSILYLVESKAQPEGFGSIPRAMWWAVVTLTTVGYGDVHPITVLGKIFGGLTALVGVGLIAMPAGILAASFSDAMQNIKSKKNKRRD